MASLSTLGQMMMMLDPKITPYDPLDVARQQNLVRGGRLQNETSLLALEEAKRQQEAAAMARQAMQQNPGLVLGGGGPQSLLGSPDLAMAPGGGPMTQQTIMPGQPPQPPQQVPGGQDLSRFATGAGMPGAMPGGAPTPTLAQLAPPQNPLIQLMRTNPDAALQILALQQKQGDVQSRLEEQQLTRREKVAGAVGQIFQGVTDQASWDDARSQIQRFSPQLAAQLPPFYNKEVAQRLVKQAVDVKSSATLAIQNMQAQAEIGKYNLQLQNAGYQGLGADVTGILKGLTPEQVQEFGGRTSDKAIAYATKKVQDLALEQKEKEGLAGAQARTQADVEARQNQTIAEAFKGETTNLYDTRSGQTLDARMKVKDYETLPAGQTKMLSNDVRKQVEQLNSAVPIIAQLQTHIDKIYGPGGALARMTPDDRALITSGTPISQRFLDQLQQKYPELVQAQRFIDANASALARALAGETGAMNEGDVDRAKAMMPSLTTSLQIWPPSKIGFRLPDTRAVALNNMNSIVDMINARGQTLLGNEQYAHPKLHRYQTAEDAQQQTGTPGPTTARPRPQDIAPEGTPAVRLNPNLPPAPGTPPPPAPGAGPFGAPPQQRYVPGEAPAPVRPEAPAPRTAPGRQSAAERPGWPKVANLADVAEAVRQTGRSRREVEEAMRAKGYRVYGSKLKLPEVTMVG